jgi:hypothetical protein
MKRFANTNAALALALIAALQLGCSNSATPDAAQKPIDSRFVLNEEPAGAIGVKELREDASKTDDVVVVGRIGGSNPWTDGAAAFSIVDPSLTPCNEIEGDACPTPWDYCCEPDLAKSTVLVKLVDDAGKTVKQDAREVAGLKELQTVVVKGKAIRDDAGNVSIAATGVHIRGAGSGAAN